MPGVRSVLPIATAEVLEDGPAIAWVARAPTSHASSGLTGDECGTARSTRCSGLEGARPGRYTLIPDRGDRRPIVFDVR